MAGIWNTILDQGGTFTRKITWKAGGVGVDLSGATIIYEIRPVSGKDRTYTLSDYIFLDDPTNGMFRIEIPDDETAEFRWSTANHRVIIEFPSSVTKVLLNGTMRVNRVLN